MVEKMESLIEHKPISMTEVFISPSRYQFKFGTRKRKDMT